MGRYRQVNIVGEYENTAISSTTDTSPVFQLMLSAVAKIQPHTVIIWKADSLGHDKYVLTMAKKILRRRAAKYTCCGEHPDELSQEHAH